MFRDTYEREYAEAVEAERVRIEQILTAPEAKGRYEGAKVLALHTDLHADAAIGILGTMPKESKLGPQFYANPQRAIDQQIDAEVERILEA